MRRAFRRIWLQALRPSSSAPQLSSTITDLSESGEATWSVRVADLQSRGGRRRSPCCCCSVPEVRAALTRLSGAAQATLQGAAALGCGPPAPAELHCGPMRAQGYPPLLTPPPRTSQANLGPVKKPGELDCREDGARLPRVAASIPPAATASVRCSIGGAAAGWPAGCPTLRPIK